MENFCKQLGVVNNIDKKKIKTIIDILHIVSIVIKLIIMILILKSIISILGKNIDWLAEFISRHNILGFIDSNRVSSDLYTTVLMIIMIPLMLIIDIIDLIINKERTLAQLIWLASLNYCFQLIGYTIYTDYEFSISLLISFIEPIIYLCIICVIYVKYQYKNKIYHKIIAKGQEEYKGRTKI